MQRLEWKLHHKLICKGRAGRKGQAAVDSMMAIILFMMMLGGLICASLYIYLENIYYTAAREGARYAATDPALADVITQAQEIVNIKQQVKNVINGAGGASIADNNITIVVPVGVLGQRTVTVTVSYRYQMPIKPMALMKGMAGDTSAGDNLDSFVVGGSSIMHYEE